MFKGSIVAIVTPMHENGELDLEKFRSLLDFHITQGTDGIVVVGTTGESPTVDFDEHHLLMQVAVEHVAKRIPVIAGTGANSTQEAIDLSLYAKKWVLMRAYRLRHTITSQHRKGFINTSKPLQKPLICHMFCIMFLVEQW